MKTPDVNVLLYAVNPDAVQHTTACRWLEAAFADASGVGFTWHALAGYLRLATARVVMVNPLPLDAALQVVDEWLAHPRAHVLHASDRHAAVLARLLIGAGRGGNLVPDAHLAAIAIENSATLGTFDHDFERFAGLRFELLQAPAVHEDGHPRLKGSVKRFDDPLSPVGDAWDADTPPRRARRKRRS